MISTAKPSGFVLRQFAEPPLNRAWNGLRIACMAIQITVPRLGWTMEEGVFVGWLKRDGDTVQPGDLLYALESDKATQEVECMDGGILRIPMDAPQPGATVAVGSLLGYVLAPGDAPRWG